MSAKVRLAAALAAGLLLSACATQPEIPFDKSQATNVKTIGILTPAMPAKPTVFLASDVGQSFGLVGALVDAGVQAHRDDAFWKSIDGTRNPPAPEFVDALSAALRARGYAVKQIPVTRQPNGSFLKTYPQASQGVDAYLDVAFTGNAYGYMAAGMGKSTPYRPYAYMECRLVRASDDTTLMQDIVLDNPIGSMKNVVSVSPDPAYVFTNFDALVADPKRAVAGMDDAFTKSADTIGDLLR